MNKIFNKELIAIIYMIAGIEFTVFSAINIDGNYWWFALGIVGAICISRGVTRIINIKL